MKKITRNVPRNSHGSVGHCEEGVKDAENQIRATIFQRYADHRCDSDKILVELPIFSQLVGHAAWSTHPTVDKQTAFFILMRKDDHKKVAKF